MAKNRLRKGNAVVFVWMQTLRYFARNVTQAAVNSTMLQETAQDFPGTEFLRTRRLVLRELRVADAPQLRRLNADERVSRWLLEQSPTHLVDLAKTIFEANRVYRHRPGLGVWHARTHENTFVGLFSLMPIADSDDIEIGARLFPNAQGRLYSVEGSAALCDCAFDILTLPRLIGFCHPQNHAVPAILRRLRFNDDGLTEHFGKPARRFVLDRANWGRRRALHAAGVQNMRQA